MSDQHDDRRDALRRLHGIPRYKMFGGEEPGVLSTPYPTSFTPEMLNVMRNEPSPMHELRRQVHTEIRRIVHMYEFLGFKNVRVESLPHHGGLKVVAEFPPESLGLFQREIDGDGDG